MKDEALHLPPEAQAVLEVGRPGHYSSHDGTWDVWIHEDGRTITRQSGTTTASLIDWIDVAVMAVPVILALTGMVLSLVALL